LLWFSATICSRNTFRLNKGSLVQFCNVNSCQSLKHFFFFFDKDLFLANNELRSWPPILIKFLTISQKQNKQTKTLPQTNNKQTPPPHQPIEVSNCTIKVECKLCYLRASLVAQPLKHLPGMWETRVRSLGREDPLEKEMASHSSTLAWRIPWAEEPGRLQSMGSQRVGHD